MEWRKCYLDVILVPLGLMIYMGYHVWLWHKVRSQPFTTVIGTNAHARRFWVSSIIKNNEQKNILAVQTLRNTIMGSTLMATTSILICSALAAVISSKYAVKRPLNDAVYGARGELTVALKYVSLLLLFLSSFVCHALAIRFAGQVNFLINCGDGGDAEAGLMERVFAMSTAGNRVFYGAVPMAMWMFGPGLVVVCAAAMVAVLYNLDTVFRAEEKGKVGGEENVGINGDV